jgi:hypothetical protein
LEEINPFVEGLKSLEIHDIANTILFFQTAVQKQLDHIDVRRIESNINLQHRTLF